MAFDILHHSSSRIEANAVSNGPLRISDLLSVRMPWAVLSEVSVLGIELDLNFQNQPGIEIESS
jgi:hypothetical protein